MKIELEIKCTEDSKISVEVLSNYILRAIAGVAAANKGVVTKYSCEEENK